MEQTHKFKC